MSKSILDLKETFPELLRIEAEKVLNKSLILRRHFPAADSFSYLLESEDESYVGKIFKFEHWPPEGKLEKIDQLLKSKNIKHEEIIFMEYEHPLFKNGWSISKYIDGGNIEQLKEKGEMDVHLYFKKIGGLLKLVHEIKFNYFGSVHDSGWKVDTFSELTQSELNRWKPEELSSEYLYEQKIIEKAKNWVLANIKKFNWSQAVLVHDDVNNRNVMWNQGDLILIDWVDSLSGVPIRDFATLTHRKNGPILSFLEEGYGQKIDLIELKFHQVMKFMRLARFYYFEGEEKDEFVEMIRRLGVILERDQPFGTILEE
jgi:hypothetical protein